MYEHHYWEKADVSMFKKAKNGNWHSGDAMHIIHTDDYILCAVADGLGSGEEAMEASEAVMNIIKAEHDRTVYSLIERSNQNLWGTRGVVMSLLKIDLHSRDIEYANVGNISCSFYYPEGKIYRPVPSRGYLSGRKQKITTETIPYEKNMVFLIYSDGLVFEPAYHAFFSRGAAPKEMVEEVVDAMNDTNDDITIMIGKMKE
ncbi:SpoIIE family protein phosphatase [Salisediminibacterium halotolerans]|uniref:Negative regulator of sigma-B (Phosphoserine phosphatase) n=1 Tax=Salisediminibacterium halotolerans TaxID=517425 RepID=A0A1H9SPV1_9BACI|nr:SpoIIE family protein phosphatase [Salisediminibacterium haloalkalitolerans]SER87042.1 negative regulator of sigma-B (phosphoserine phosphatase) [Salisediminibacterium haloalkalitolerans]